MTITGGCFCGELRYELRSELGLIANCHCGFCRRVHGAPFTTISMIPVDAFKWISGTPTVFTTPMGNVRNFCPRCASPTCNFQPVGDFASLVLGSIDSQFPFEPWFHVNVESRVRWIELGELPAFEGWPEFDEIRVIAEAHPSAWLPDVVKSAGTS